MQFRYLTALVISILLMGVASAREYSIRANRGLNLRAAPSLSADIADTVRTGDVLQVVGNSGGWLKISRNGNEVWLADWVNFSRIDSEPLEAPAATPIDNCCFVDRLCQSDQEWIDGYWAYQRNECPAPVEQPTEQSSQPAADASPEVNNCCFVDRQCLTDEEWVSGYWAYQNRQCAAAPAQSQAVTPAIQWPPTGGNCCSVNWRCRFEEERVQGLMAYQLFQCADPTQTSAITLTGPVPRIEGSDRFVNHMVATLKLMKRLAPDWYNYVITAMDVIAEEPVELPPGYYDGQYWQCTARAHTGQRRASFETCWIDLTSRISGNIAHDQADTAAALGHEACHLHLYAEGVRFSSTAEEEAACRKFGTGIASVIDSAIAAGLNPRRGTLYWNKDKALSLLRTYCSQGHRADLFCSTLQQLESEWANVPYAVFPPGAPQW